MRHKLWAWIFVGLSVGVISCKDPTPPQDSSPTPSPNTSTEQAPSAPPTDHKSPDVTTWRATPAPKLLALMLRAQTECQISGAGSSPRGCPQLDDALDEAIKEAGIEALETLLWGLDHEHEQTRALSAWLIQANITPKHLEVLLEQPPTQAQRQLSGALLMALGRHDSSDQGTHLWAAVAVHLGELTRQDELVSATLGALKDEQTRANAIRALMRFGRTRAFELVKAQALDKTQPTFVRAALDAPMLMPSWSDQERELVCPWYLTFLPDLSRDYTERPAQAMRRCGGIYLDHLIDELASRVTARSFDRPFSFAIRKLVTEQPTDKLLIPSAKQLERARALLEQAAKDEQLDAGGRAFAMSTLTQRWPDQQTEQMLKQLTSCPDPKLADEARDGLKLLLATRQLRERMSKPAQPPTQAPR